MSANDHMLMCTAVGIDDRHLVPAVGPKALVRRVVLASLLVVLLAGAWVASASTSAVALALSSLSRLRIVRVVLMALLP